jgi:hypothetical protein
MGRPPDHWRYAVYLNGACEPHAVQADVSRGTVTVAAMDGQLYDVKTGATRMKTGKVEIVRKDLLGAVGGNQGTA